MGAELIVVQKEGMGNGAPTRKIAKMEARNTQPCPG